MVGYKRSLTYDDLCDINYNDKSHMTVHKFETRWAKELKKATRWERERKQLMVSQRMVLLVHANSGYIQVTIFLPFGQYVFTLYTCTCTSTCILMWTLIAENNFLFDAHPFVLSLAW